MVKIKGRKSLVLRCDLNFFTSCKLTRQLSPRGGDVTSLKTVELTDRRF